MIDIDAYINTETFQHSSLLCMLNGSLAHANLSINRVLGLVNLGLDLLLKPVSGS